MATNLLKFDGMDFMMQDEEWNEMQKGLNDLSWNEYSKEYNDLSTFDDKLLHLGLGIPGQDASLFVKSDMKVLDVGCGNGTNTHIMSRYTNEIVVGIDFAYPSIKSAQKAYQANNLIFLQYSFCDFVQKENCSVYDLITFWGSLDYMRLNDDFFTALNKITVEKSSCVISKFHPFWSTLYDNDVDPEQGHSYFENGREDRIRYGKDRSHEFIRFHYTIGYMLDRFKKYGWNISRILEPKPDFKASAFTYQDYDTDSRLMARLSRIPMTIIMIFVRR